jgi:hypothetical protein
MEYFNLHSLFNCNRGGHTVVCEALVLLLVMSFRYICMWLLYHRTIIPQVTCLPVTQFSVAFSPQANYTDRRPLIVVAVSAICC